MFGGDAEEKLLALGFPPIAVGIVNPDSEPVNAPIKSAESVVSDGAVSASVVQVSDKEVVVEKPQPVVLHETVIRTYIVKEGETLGEIASRELGSYRSWREIATLNGIDDPSRISSGRTLRLPARATVQKRIPVKAATPISTPIANGKTHRVLEGETMSSIAGDFYDDVNKYFLIAQANPSIDPARLQIGMVLVIPPR
jgi:nucleoid-associated protein YgaU